MTRRDPGPRFGPAQPGWKVPGPGFPATPLGSGWPQRSARADPDTKRRGVPRPDRGGLKRQRPDLRRGISAARGSPGVLQSLPGAEERRCGDQLPPRRPAPLRPPPPPEPPARAPPDTHRHTLSLTHARTHTHTHTRHPRRAGATSERRRAGLEVGVLPHSPAPVACLLPLAPTQIRTRRFPSCSFDFGHLHQIIGKRFQKVGNVT